MNCVFSQKVGRFYLQQYAVTIGAQGEWSSVTYLGVDADQGVQFDILAAVSDEKGQTSFNTYLIFAAASCNWSGLDKLLEGVVNYSRVSVTWR